LKAKPSLIRADEIVTLVWLESSKNETTHHVTKWLCGFIQF